MANLPVKDYKKEVTPRLEKASLIRGLQILRQVKTIHKLGMPTVKWRLVTRWSEPGYKL